MIHAKPEKIENWEFSMAEVVDNFFRDASNLPSQFSIENGLKFLYSKLTLTDKATNHLLQKFPVGDLVELSRKVPVQTCLRDHIILINLALLGVKRATRVLEEKENIDSLDLPPIPRIP
jgi:hypothetical protein